MSAETARLASVHNKLGKPGGPGLFHDKSSQLPAYIQNVAKALERSGKPESQAIQIAIGTVKRWAAGGGGVSPEVKAAAAKAVAEWEALKAKARAKPNKGGGGADLSNALDVAARKKAAKAGEAMPDGSYPIRSVDELHKAVQAFGRAKDKAAVKKHIVKRAKALKAAGVVPQDWSGTGGFSVDLATSTEVTPGLGMIALEVPAGAVPELPGGTPVDDMHVTLCFLGSDVTDSQLAQALMRAYDLTYRQPVTGTVGGLGVFPPDAEGKSAVYVPVDAPGLADMASALGGLAAGVQHGFTPHITRGYITDGDKIPSPVASNPVTFTQLIVKRGDQVFRFPLGQSEGQKAQGYAAVRATAIELSTASGTKAKKSTAPAKGDQASAKFGEPDLPKGAVGWKHGWIPVDSSGKAVGPAEKPGWLQKDEKAQLAAGGKTAQGYRDAAAAKSAASAAKSKAEHSKAGRAALAAADKKKDTARARAAAKVKSAAAKLTRSKTSAAKKEAAAAKKAATAKQRVIMQAYRQALADQKAGRKLTPQQLRVIGSVQAAQAKQAASLRSVDVPGAKAAKATTTAPKAATKPLTTAQKNAAAAAAEKAKIAAERAKVKKGGVTWLANEVGDRVNSPFVLDLAGSRMPSGHLAFRFKHGWILINPAIPSRGQHGSGLAAMHGHKSGTVTHGHFEDHPSGKGKIFVADRTGGKLPSPKNAELKLKAASAPHTKAAYTTAAQGTPKPSGDVLNPTNPSPEAAHALTKAANQASQDAKANPTSVKHAQVAAKRHAVASVAQTKIGNDKVAQGHKNNAQAWQGKAVQLKKAEAATTKLKAQHDAQQKAQADEQAKAKKAAAEADYEQAKAKAQAASTEAFANETGHAHVLAQDAHEKAAEKAAAAGNTDAQKAHTGVAGIHSDKAQKHYEAKAAAKAKADADKAAKAEAIGKKKDELLDVSAKADAQTAAVEGADVGSSLHTKIAAKHAAAAKLADEVGAPALAKHHKALAADHTAKAAAPKPVATPDEGGLSLNDAIGDAIDNQEVADGSPAAWDDYLQAAHAFQNSPSSKTKAATLLAAKKELEKQGVSTAEMQAAHALVQKKMKPAGAAKKTAKKTVAAKKTAKKVAPAASTAPKVVLPGPGMYADSNAIKAAQQKADAMSPGAAKDAAMKRVADAKAAFYSKHGNVYAPSKAGTEAGYTGGYDTSYDKNIHDSFFDDAAAAGFDPVQSHESANGDWKPSGKLASNNGAYNYSGGAYSEINAQLRNHSATGGSNDATIKQMDREFKAVPPLDHGISTIRQMDGDGPFPGNPPPMTAGAEFQDLGYSSTSKKTGTWGGETVMQVRIPKGARVLDLNHTTGSQNSGEQEILLNRGTKYRVVSDSTSGSKRNIVVEVVI